MADETIYIECACRGLDHLVRVSLSEWDQSDGMRGDGPELQIEMMLNHYGPWWQRWLRALGYALGRCRADYDCCLIGDIEQIDKLLAVIHRARIGLVAERDAINRVGTSA